MKILSGYLQPTEGSATVAGCDVVDNSICARRARVFARKRAALSRHDGAGNTRHGRRSPQIPDANRKTLLSEAIYAAGIDKQLTKLIGTLRRASGSACASRKPSCTSPKSHPRRADERLDPTQIVEMRSLIARLAEHATVLVSTHILSEVEATCHRAIITRKA